MDSIGSVVESPEQLLHLSDCSRSDVVAKIEMVGRGIIEIDRALDEPQPKQADIEIKVPLRIAGDGRDVMDGHGEWL